MRRPMVGHSVESAMAEQALANRDTWSISASPRLSTRGGSFKSSASGYEHDSQGWSRLACKSDKRIYRWLELEYLVQIGRCSSFTLRVGRPVVHVVFGEKTFVNNLKGCRSIGHRGLMEATRVYAHTSCVLAMHQSVLASIDAV
jgi:hypothetical protein